MGSARKRPKITKAEIHEKLSYEELVAESERLHGWDNRMEPEVRSVRREIVIRLGAMEQERAEQIYREEREGKRPPGQQIKP